MRCPSCGARNPESAAWCSQCYAPLGRDEPTAAERPASPEPSLATASTSTPSGDAEQVVSGGNTTFRRTAEGLDWQCGRCETFNPIEVQYCSVCGHSFSDTVRGPEERAAPQIDENVAVVTSAILPGTGHYLARARATGLARAVVYVLFVAGGWLLLREASASGQTVLPAVPLLIGAFVVWAGSVYDALLLARGERRQLLAGRAFFWLVIGVLGTLMATFAVAALSVSTG